MALLLQDRLLPGVAELVPELEEIRHDIHAHPELGFETERTVGLICDYHRKSGIVEIDTELVKGCVIAVIEGSRRSSAGRPCRHESLQEPVSRR